jgi:hypothetical protein
MRPENRMEKRCLQRSGYPDAQPSREPVYIAIPIGMALDEVTWKRSLRAVRALRADRTGCDFLQTRASQPVAAAELMRD